MARYIDIDGKDMLTKFTLCLDMPYRQGWNACLDYLQIRVVEDVAPIKHSKWIKCFKLKKKKGMLIFPSEPSYYRCEECGRIELNKEPFCNCGCKMDKE